MFPELSPVVPEKEKKLLSESLPREALQLDSFSKLTLDARPILDLRKYKVQAPVEELVGRVAVYRDFDARSLANLDAPLLHVRLGLGEYRRLPRDGEQGGARHQQVVRLLDALGHVRRDRDLQQLRDVPEGDLLLDRLEAARTSGPALGPVLVVRRRIVPRSQPLSDRLWLGPGRLVLVGHRHEVGRDGALVRIAKTREVERPGHEVAGHGIGGRGGLYWVQRTAIVLRRVVLVPVSFLSALGG